MRRQGGILRMGAFCLLAVCLFSCGRPASEEQFVRTDQADAWGRYVFAVDFDDPACTYALDLLVSLDCKNVEFKSFGGMKLGMLWESPSGIPYEESLTVGPGNAVGGNFFSKYLRTGYRTDLRPAEYGRWTLYVSVPDAQEAVCNVSGIGLVMKREQHGSR